MDLEKMTLLRALGKSRMGAVKLYREGDVGENVEGVAAFTAVKVRTWVLMGRAEKPELDEGRICRRNWGGVLVVTSYCIDPLLILPPMQFIDRKSASTPGNAKRIFSEKKSLVDLSKHPYIVQLKGTGKDEEWLYFYMKPLLGGALHKHFRAEVG